MSIYCIGDLHGRYDLFTMLLERIDFDPLKDKLYLLGDVIDRSYGGIEIIHYLMENQDSCNLIRGNHENIFLSMENEYDAIMLSPKIKQAVAIAVERYSDELFSKISNDFAIIMGTKKRCEFYNSPTIKKWLNEGKPHIRKPILETMIDLAEEIQFDVDKYWQIKRVLNNFKEPFRTKPFVQELLTQSEENYFKIKEFLKQTPENHYFAYGGKVFNLNHSKDSINESISRQLLQPHANSHNGIYIFGHEPVPLYHRYIHEINYISFDFDYRRIFSWIDANHNRYYNLDLSSNPIAALKLDDMSEYYVGDTSAKRNATPWTVPEKVSPTPGITIRYVENVELGKISFERNTPRKYAMVSLDNGCYEFLIGISKYSKRIYYTRISMIDFNDIFQIDDWLDGQADVEVIDKVRTDFEIQRK